MRPRNSTSLFKLVLVQPPLGFFDGKVFVVEGFVFLLVIDCCISCLFMCILDKCCVKVEFTVCVFSCSILACTIRILSVAVSFLFRRRFAKKNRSRLDEVGRQAAVQEFS